MDVYGERGAGYKEKMGGEDLRPSNCEPRAKVSAWLAILYAGREAGTLHVLS